jgi:hypothetical protein
METKRCRYCHKLSPAYAQVCNRCGHPFTPRSTPGTRRGPGRRSIPPASPHRIGYHAGLHPEDQPYQSSLLPAVQPSAVRDESSEPVHQAKEPEQILLQAQEILSPPSSEHRQKPSSPASASPLRPSSTPEPASPPPAPSDAPEEVWQAHYPPRRRIVPAFLIVLCLLLLAVSSILSYLVINRKPITSAASPALTVTPHSLRVGESFTLAGRGFGAGDLLDIKRDGNIAVSTSDGSPLQVHANAVGAFTVAITVGADWHPGLHQIFVIDQGQLLSVSTSVTVLEAPPATPQLKLSDYEVNLGADVPGAATQEAITLLNVGAGQLSWQASSDRTWLSVTPESGSFSNSQSVTLTVRRLNLAPGHYTGRVTFRQTGAGGTPQIVTVDMTVLSASGSLSLSPASLTFTTSAAQNPPAQSVTLQNTGTQPLDWSSKVASGSAWLRLTPGSGHLAPGASVTVSVSVSPGGLALGSYQSSVIFQGGGSPQLTVTLNVVAPGNLVVSPTALSVSATQGENPADQTVTLQNTGGLVLDWSLSSSTQDGTHWLSATPTSGHLAPGASASVKVHLSTASLATGSYQGSLSFEVDAGATPRQVSVTLTVKAAPAPAIAATPAILIFDVSHGSNPAAQTVTITNTGNAPLNWSISGDASSPPVTITPASGQALAPGRSVQVSIAPVVAQLPANTSQSLTLTVSDSDPGNSVASQQILILIAII